MTLERKTGQVSGEEQKTNLGLRSSLVSKESIPRGPRAARMANCPPAGSEPSLPRP